MSKSMKSCMFLIFCLMFVMMLAGCSSSEDVKNLEEDGKSPKVTEGTKQDNKDPQYDTKKKYNISIAAYHIGPTDQDGDLLKYWGDKHNVEFNILNLENNQYEELLSLKFASGDVPDRMLVRSFSSLQKFAQQDVLAEIPMDLLKEHAPTVVKLLEQEQPDVFKHGEVNGKLYGIPYIVPTGLYRTAIIYRGDWMKNVGVDKAPQTLKEYENLMYKFAKDDPDKNGKNDTYGLSYSAMSTVFGAFGYMPDIFNGDKGNDKPIWQERDGDLVYSAVQPEMKDALGLLHKWYKDGVIDPEFITGENQGGYWALSHGFMNNRIGVTNMGYYYHWNSPLYTGHKGGSQYREMQKGSQEAADSLVWGEPVKGPEGKSGVWQQNLLNGNFTSFGKQLENDKAKLIRILQILEDMNKDFLSETIAFYGIEGKHWNFKEADGVKLVEPAQGFKKAPERQKIGGHAILNPNKPLEYWRENSEFNVRFANEKNLEEGGIKNQLETALPSGAKYTAELKKLQEEAYISIITGDKPISYFDEFVTEWKKAGGELLEKEANEWYATVK